MPDDFNRLLTVGSLPPPPSDLTAAHIDLGPDHPTRPGLVTIPVHVEDGRLTRAKVEIGYLHRGAEKLFEVRDYRQLIMLASRHDWQAPFVGELGAAVVVERALGLVCPPRVTWIRTLLMEFSRISSHLAFLSWLPYADDDVATARSLHTCLASAHVLWEELSGNRVHPMITRIGGISVDVESAWSDHLEEWLEAATAVAESLRTLIRSPQMRRRTAGIAVLRPDDVDAFGLSGPVARATGLQIDDRWRPGHLAHHGLVPAPVDAPTDGDAHSRFSWLIGEIGQSADLCRQVMRALPGVNGPLETHLPTVVRTPRGTTWSALEAPWGQAGYLLVSNGGSTPGRLALRTPTFADVAALEHILPGTRLDDVPAAIASLGWTLGDLDK
ncbi:NADH-quinone oxidoreductase subunit D [Acidipropionibacterium virtanenii]|uniref:NADH-quinone oxidoreductase subunit 4 n=1 Tax=Acidipropionibacterium virtanenii TaxID=2057246 RepID=A0A344URF8_9ACTN|nr:NADH-quinone oxidoreductase subunit D [Acidipropionibacterium virtanenii]AXE37856.1 NADH-quinone oxidoreductase subunit 4 [Acidipropionibacterium virtanenii]